MQLAVTGPCPAGCALIRDCRAWHGGTPNLSRGVRAIPSVAVSAPWYNGADRRGPRSNSERVPRSVFNSLSAHGAAFGPLRKRLTCHVLSAVCVASQGSTWLGTCSVRTAKS